MKVRTTGTIIYTLLHKPYILLKVHFAFLGGKDVDTLKMTRSISEGEQELETQLCDKSKDRKCQICTVQCACVM